MDQMIGTRDFSSISPSARWLLLLKGYTSIPFAREAAEQLEYPEKYIPDFNRRDFTLWAGAYHFESRYRSIDQLLKDLPVHNILELSSGYSFRSLDYSMRKGVHYIDTDLPDVITTKKRLVDNLTKEGFNAKGKLELLPLNALDQQGFNKIIGKFDPGEVAIVNEGLLTYLDKEEQKKLLSIIHDILIERGGCWITADIYLKNKQPRLGFTYDDEKKDFYKQHDTESNSFESFKEAELFFRDMGFVIDKEARIKASDMSSLKYLVKSLTLRQFFRLLGARKIQATWRLKAV